MWKISEDALKHFTKFPGKEVLEERFKMTREEAVKIVVKTIHAPKDHAEGMVDMLKALGILKFDEEKKETEFKILINQTLYQGFIEKYGIMRIENWPEGLVFWVGGKIVYRSWEHKSNPNSVEEILNRTKDKDVMFMISTLKAHGYEIIAVDKPA